MPQTFEDGEVRLLDDIKQFSRRIRLKEFFYDPDATDANDVRIPFRKKSTWTPQLDREPALETYIQTIKEQIVSKLDQGPRRCSHDNISAQQRKA